MMIKTKRLLGFNNETKSYDSVDYTFNTDTIQDISPFVNGCVLTLKESVITILISADYDKLTQALSAVEV